MCVDARRWVKMRALNVLIKKTNGRNRWKLFLIFTLQRPRFFSALVNQPVRLLAFRNRPVELVTSIKCHVCSKTVFRVEPSNPWFSRLSSGMIFFFFKLCLSFGPSPDFRCRQWWSPYTEYSRSRRGLNARVSPRGRSGTRLSRVRTMRTHRMRPVGPRPYARVPGIAIIIAITISRICGRQNTAYVFLNVKKPG